MAFAKYILTLYAFIASAVLPIGAMGSSINTEQTLSDTDQRLYERFKEINPDRAELWRAETLERDRKWGRREKTMEFARSSIICAYLAHHSTSSLAVISSAARRELWRDGARLAAHGRNILRDLYNDIYDERSDESKEYAVPLDPLFVPYVRVGVIIAEIRDYVSNILDEIVPRPSNLGFLSEDSRKQWGARRAQAALDEFRSRNCAYISMTTDAGSD